jgi:hypothetical protein
MLLLTRTVNRVDLANMREIAGALGLLAELLGWLINMLERFMSILR